MSVDRIRQTSTSTGTGGLVLAAARGYRAFSDEFTSGSTIDYVIDGLGANGKFDGAWEIGIGTLGVDGKFVRNQVTYSSNSNNKVNFSSQSLVIVAGITEAAIRRLQPTVITSHASLSDIGNNTHTQIDTAINLASTHFSTASAHGVSTVAGLTETQTFTNKTFADPTTPSKILALDLSGISASTTRTLTIPNASGTIALTSDIPTVITSHASLSDIGNNTHTQIDTAINLASTHFSTASAHGVSTVAGLTETQTFTNKYLDDTTTKFRNTSATTKLIAISAANITAGTTRTYTGPDADGNLLLAPNYSAGFIPFMTSSGVSVSTGFQYDSTNIGLGIGTNGNAAYRLNIYALSSDTQYFAYFQNASYFGAWFRQDGAIQLGQAQNASGLIGIGGAPLAGNRCVVYGIGVNTSSYNAFGVLTGGGLTALAVRDDQQVQINKKAVIGAVNAGTNAVTLLSLKAESTTSEAFALVVQDSGNGDICYIRNDGYIQLGLSGTTTHLIGLGVAPVSNNRVTIQGIDTTNGTGILRILDSGGTLKGYWRGNGNLSILNKVRIGSTNEGTYPLHVTGDTNNSSSYSIYGTSNAGSVYFGVRNDGLVTISGGKLTTNISGTAVAIWSNGTTTGLGLQITSANLSTVNFSIADNGGYAFRGGTVGVAQTGYTAFQNGATIRSVDTATVTLQQLAQTVGTLVEDLKTKGIIAQ